MKDSASPRAGSGWKHFRYESRPDSPFAAHSHGDQEPQHTDVLDVGGESGQSGEDGIEEDRESHNWSASPAVGQRAEDPSAECAAKEEHSEEPIAPETHERILWVAFQQVREHLGASDIEELSFEGVEDPAQRSNQQDCPLIASDSAVPRFSIHNDTASRVFADCSAARQSSTARNPSCPSACRGCCPRTASHILAICCRSSNTSPAGPPQSTAWTD